MGPPAWRREGNRRRRPRRRPVAAVSRQKRREHLKGALALTALTGAFVALTVSGVAHSIHRYGHVHLNFFILLLDFAIGGFAAAKWTQWLRSL